MKKCLLSLLFAFTMYAQCPAQEFQEMINKGGHTVQEIQLEAEAYFKVGNRRESSEFKMWKRWEYDAVRLADNQGMLRSKRETLQRIHEYNQRINTSSVSRSPNACLGDWSSLGPEQVTITSGYNPGVGRITSIGIDQSNEDHFIVGAETGGVWQTKDGGETWVALTDEFVNLDVYALEIAPSDPTTFYWGASDGMIFRSDDAGQTWQELKQLEEFSNVHRIIVNPRNKNELWICNSREGLYHSQNGGMSWTKLSNETFYDLEFHPTDTNVIYASGYGIFKSVDGGRSFTDLNFEANRYGVKMIAVTPAAPSNLYIISEYSGSFGGIYKSNDEGENFMEFDHSGKNYFGYSFIADDFFGQAPRDMDLAVSSTDSNVIYMAGINLWKSEDGGSTFDVFSHWYHPTTLDSNVAYTHADIDILVPQNDRLLIGSDGGIYSLSHVSDSTSSTAVEDISKGLAIQQFYRIGLAQSIDEIVVGGAQDNGSSVFVEGEWRNYFGADGMEGFVTGGDTTILYGTYQGGGLVKSTDLGKTVEDLRANGLEYVYGAGAWVTPFEKSTANPSTIFAGYDHVYRSDDKGDNFYPISQNFGYSSSLSQLKIARGRDDILYASTFAGTLYKGTSEFVSEWKQVYQTDYFERINCIAIHPRNPDLVALAVSGTDKVIITTDGGLTWNLWNEGLPSFTSLCLTWQNDDQETLYLGMNYGVYRRSTGENEWQAFAQGLPNVRINELEINEATDVIYAGTYGRGLWSSPICPTMVGNTNIFENLDVTCTPNLLRSNQLLTIKSGAPLKTDIRIFNSTGQIVYRSLDVEISNHHDIRWGNFPAGTYYLRLSNPDGMKVFPLISN